MKEPSIDFLLSWPSCMVPKKIMLWAYLEHFFLHKMKYTKEHAFQDVPNATKFYHGNSLTVRSDTRGHGLGKELVERTNVIAKEKGCSHVYISAGSVYSQAIFKKLNFEVLHEGNYGEAEGPNGTKLFKDMREHKSIQIIVFDLSNLVTDVLEVSDVS